MSPEPIATNGVVLKGPLKMAEKIGIWDQKIPNYTYYRGPITPFITGAHLVLL